MFDSKTQGIRAFGPLITLLHLCMLSAPSYSFQWIPWKHSCLWGANSSHSCSWLRLVSSLEDSATFPKKHL